jgi:hypothetical protein
MEVDAVEVLHYGLLQGQSIVDVVLNQHRDQFQTSQASGTPATLPRYEFVEIDLTLNGTDDQRLEDPQFSN